jgi:hypothetical protein
MFRDGYDEIPSGFDVFFPKTAEAPEEGPTDLDCGCVYGKTEIEYTKLLIHDDGSPKKRRVCLGSSVACKGTVYGNSGRRLCITCRNLIDRGFTAGVEVADFDAGGSFFGSLTRSAAKRVS